MRKVPLPRQPAFLILPVFCILHLFVSACVAQNTRTWEQLMTSAVRAQRTGALNEAEQLCREAMLLATNLVPPDIRFSRSQILMGEIYRWQKKPELAEQFFKDAIASTEKAVGSKSPALIDSLEGLANLYYFDQTNYARVIPLYQRILTIVEEAPDRNERELAIRARNLASVHCLLKNYPAAEPLYQRALVSAEKSMNRTEFARELITVADFYRSWNKCTESESLATRAVELMEKNVEPDTELDLAWCLDGLAAAYIACGKPDVAEPLCRQALAITEKVAGSNHPDLAPRLTRLAAALQARHKFEQADLQFERALAVTQAGLGTNSPELAILLEKRADLLKSMGKSSEAKSLLTRADAIHKSTASQK